MGAGERARAAGFVGRRPSARAARECEEGVRTIGGLVGATADQLRMDMPMVVDFAPSPDGDLVPQWRPA